MGVPPVILTEPRRDARITLSPFRSQRHRLPKMSTRPSSPKSSLNSKIERGKNTEGEKRI